MPVAAGSDIVDESVTINRLHLLLSAVTDKKTAIEVDG